MDASQQGDPATSSEDLLVALSKGQRDAWQSLSERHRPGLCRLCLALTGDANLAEDCCQDFFLRLPDRAKHFKPGPGASAEAWLKRCVANLARNAMRDRYRQQRKLRTLAKQGDIETTEHTHDQSEHLHILRQALNRLGRRQHEHLCQYYFSDFDYEDLARDWKCSINGARVRVHRARQALRKHIENIASAQALAWPLPLLDTYLSDLPTLAITTSMPVHASHAPATLTTGMGLATKLGLLGGSLVTSSLLVIGTIQAVAEEDDGDRHDLPHQQTWQEVNITNARSEGSWQLTDKASIATLQDLINFTADRKPAAPAGWIASHVLRINTGVAIKQVNFDEQSGRYSFAGVGDFQARPDLGPFLRARGQVDLTRLQDSAHVLRIKKIKDMGGSKYHYSRVKVLEIIKQQKSNDSNNPNPLQHNQELTLGYRGMGDGLTDGICTVYLNQGSTQTTEPIYRLLGATIAQGVSHAHNRSPALTISPGVSMRTVVNPIWPVSQSSTALQALQLGVEITVAKTAPPYSLQPEDLHPWAGDPERYGACTFEQFGEAKKLPAISVAPGQTITWYFSACSLSEDPTTKKRLIRIHLHKDHQGVAEYTQDLRPTGQYYFAVAMLKSIGRKRTSLVTDGLWCSAISGSP